MQLTKFEKLLSVLLLSVAAITSQSRGQSFNKQYVGVAYSPYVKNWEGSSTPYWNSYSIDDIKQMLRIVSTKFSTVTTYGMGVNQWNVGGSWDQGDGNCLIARGAAQLNRGANSKLLTVNIGVHQNNDATQQRKEISAAFSAAQDANSIYSGTVTGITFLNEYVTSPSTGATVLNMIRNNKGRGFNVGTRVHVCGEIQNPNSALYPILRDIVKESHFIYCNLYPDASVVNSGIPPAVQAVANAFLSIRTAFQRINPDIEVMIGETGWPSMGKSFNSSPNSDQNLGAFWTQMAQWATNNRVKVQMFEAFNEPWKSNINNQDPNSSSGRYGAEGHYGWWYLQSNNKPYYYVEKFTGQRYQ